MQKFQLLKPEQEIVHTYFDESGDLAKGTAIIVKCQNKKGKCLQCIGLFVAT